MNENEEETKFVVKSYLKADLPICITQICRFPMPCANSGAGSVRTKSSIASFIRVGKGRTTTPIPAVRSA